jgi:hypothetical protein
VTKKKPTFHNIADQYSIPVELVGHVSCLFNTVQIPVIDKKVHIKNNQEISKNGKQLKDSVEPVTVPFLNELYQITDNFVTDATFSQAVFETGWQEFSQHDLNLFQTEYGLHVQPAEDPSDMGYYYCFNCYEGNLDLQYIMGIAQNVPTVYWYTQYDYYTDPFLSWILSVANATDPPLVNSISWASYEYVSS